MSQSTSTRPFPWIGLVTLACAVFVAVTTEFLPTGLLPEMARDFRVSESKVGLLVTVFAGTVVLATTPLAILTRHYSRKVLVIVVLLVVAFGAVLAAVAPTYEILVGARIVGGLAHGLFWAVVGAYGSHLVPRHQLGRAVAITSSGGTAAFVLGVPLGTAVGHFLGWRLAFAFMAGLIVVLCFFVLKFLPAVDHRVTLATGEIELPLRKDRSLPVLLTISSVIIVIMVAQNTFYTYIAPYLIQISGFDESAVPTLLLLYGGAGAVGLILAGFVAGRYPRSGLIVAFLVVTASVIVLAVFHGQPIVVVASIVVWGIAFGGTPTMLQTRMLHSASARMRDTAAALTTTAFNLAIGGGALLGGILLDQFGLGFLPAADVVLLVAGIALMIVTDVWMRRRAARPKPR
jgi:predicted MFS family arabinose efflux permease